MPAQQPTCVNTRIRSTLDAEKIFMATRHSILPMVTRRLDAEERASLRSGCCYAWEERGGQVTEIGIERFTEGRRWSPSRVRDSFLFYYEKWTPDTDANATADTQQAPRDWDQLVKQTYSVWIDTAQGRKKWHLTAYFTQSTVDDLGTIDDIPGVSQLEVPEGLFQSTRSSKRKRTDDALEGEDSSTRLSGSPKARNRTVSRTFTSFSAVASGSRPPQPIHPAPATAVTAPVPAAVIPSTAPAVQQASSVPPQQAQNLNFPQPLPSPNYHGPVSSGMPAPANSYYPPPQYQRQQPQYDVNAYSYPPPPTVIDARYPPQNYHPVPSISAENHAGYPYGYPQVFPHSYYPPPPPPQVQQPIFAQASPACPAQSQPYSQPGYQQTYPNQPQQVVYTTTSNPSQMVPHGPFVNQSPSQQVYPASYPNGQPTQQSASFSNIQPQQTSQFRYAPSLPQTDSTDGSYTLKPVYYPGQPQQPQSPPQYNNNNTNNTNNGDEIVTCNPIRQRGGLSRSSPPLEKEKAVFRRTESSNSSRTATSNSSAGSSRVQIGYDSSLPRGYESSMSPYATSTRTNTTSPSYKSVSPILSFARRDSTATRDSYNNSRMSSSGPETPQTSLEPEGSPNSCNDVRDGERLNIRISVDTHGEFTPSLATLNNSSPTSSNAIMKYHKPRVQLVSLPNLRHPHHAYTRDPVDDKTLSKLRRP